MEARIDETRDSITDIWGERTPYYGTHQWPVRVDERTSEKPDKWVQSACVMCSNGCGMDIGVKDGRIVGVRGRAVDRVNKGRLGPKGLHSYVANHSSDRLTHPLIRKNGKLERASWNEAMELIVKKTKETQEELSVHGIGFYTSGQLFLEEYYTLAVIGKGGLRSLHMDGNTRLCTATAAVSMRENFGCDGQPGSYTDIDCTDCIFLVGHNIAATQTVLWARMLDRIHGPNPPKIVVMDPRTTSTAKEATLHIMPNIGTNLAVLNCIQYLLLERGWVDHDFISNHTIGIETLREIVSSYKPEYVEQISGVPAAVLLEAAQIIGTARSLLSTALQGVYQSNQATASACGINNINLLRGMIGKPGAGIYQMNGQPTAQNNREAGCNGEYPGFRNSRNINHMQDLADHWNISVNDVPHWNEPTHIMSMLHFMETGTIKMFWVSGTNPAVSLPELDRIRRLFTSPNLFLVVQDIFMTETAQLADVVLPAAMWGEKTGCFTNVDRTVHISHKAIDPPGEARSDLDIFVDYARRMDFRDKDNKPLVYWTEPEEAFEAWKDSTEGRPCDYTGMTYAKLTGGSGIQWPCNEKTCPDGTERLFTDFRFPTDHDHAESWGHDLETGAPLSEEEYRKLNPSGRAILKPAHYIPMEETTNDQYPLRLSTGRNVYQFHTRTKTGRAQALQAAAPDAFIQVSAKDAERLGIADGDYVAVSSRRGSVELAAKVGEIGEGQVFIPFHYGYWDSEDGRSRAANELTLSGWDSVSKQPFFKSGAVKMEKLDGVKIFARSKQSSAARHKEDVLQATNVMEHVERHRFLEDFVGLLVEYNVTLLGLYDGLIKQHSKQMEVRAGLKVLQALAQQVKDKLAPFAEKYKPDKQDAVTQCGRQSAVLFPPERQGSSSFKLLMDLQALHGFVGTMAGIVTALVPTTLALKDVEFSGAIQFVQQQVSRQQHWVAAQMKTTAPQTLIVPAPSN